jgi:MFS family permease
VRTAPTTRDALRISNIEGCWASLHFTLVSGVFFTAYALFLGANDFQLGLLSAVALLAQVFQIPGAYLVEKTGQRRTMVGWFSVASRILWLPIALIPLFVRHHAVRAFLILYFLSSIAMNLAAPGWIAWMSALVPAPIRGRYFGMRNRITGIVAIMASIGGGLVVDAFDRAQQGYAGYLLLDLVAVGGALAAFRMILRQPDPGYRAEQLPAMARYLFRPMRDPNYRRLLVFYLYWLFAVSVASPFFNAHLLNHMMWNKTSIAVLGVIGSVTTILCQTMWGRMVDRHGHKPVLMITAIGIIHIPFYYAFCPWGLRWPIYLSQVLGGFFWAGFGLASFSQLIDILPSTQRTMYVAVLSALSGITTFAATTLSGWLANLLADFRWEFMHLTVVNYQVLFVITGVLRIPALLLLRRIRAPEAKGTREAFRWMFTQLVGNPAWMNRTGGVSVEGIGIDRQKPV